MLEHGAGGMEALGVDKELHKYTGPGTISKTKLWHRGALCPSGFVSHHQVPHGGLLSPKV
jgi:hypothetical protein